MGKTFTQQEIDNFSLADLKFRRILDPAYAGFEADFDWHNYVDIKVTDPQVREKIEISLNEMAQTPEGQHVLRQSLAMETFRTTGEVVDKDHLLQHPKGQVNRVRFYMGDSGNNYDRKYGEIELDLNSINTTQFHRTDGTYTNSTFQETIYHELLHSADGLNTKENRDMIDRSHTRPYWDAYNTAYDRQNPALDSIIRGDNAVNAVARAHPNYYEDLKAGPIEYAAINEANLYISDRLNGKPRVFSHGDWEYFTHAEDNMLQVVNPAAPVKPPPVIVATVDDNRTSLNQNPPFVSPLPGMEDALRALAPTTPVAVSDVAHAAVQHELRKTSAGKDLIITT